MHFLEIAHKQPRNGVLKNPFFYFSRNGLKKPEMKLKNPAYVNGSN